MHVALLALILSVQARKAPPPALGLAESVPVETTLDAPAIPDAQETWIELIRSARHSLDIAEFYIAPQADSEGEGFDPADARLEPVLAAIEKAGRKGVAVRVLADAKFAKTYPHALERLDAARGVTVRRYDMKPVTGGVLHAKYFIVDDQQAWLGSQNFDWRSLTHVMELGARVAEPHTVHALAATFALDWALAGGEPRPEPVELSNDFPVTVPFGEGEVQLTPVMSPKDLLPDADLWDLPRIIALIDGAQDHVHVQLLGHSTSVWKDGYWDELDRALRRAAARGVHVELLVADWSKKKWKVETLQSLQCMPRIDVRFVVIPEWSKGHIPFGRVVHSKFMVVDGEHAWVGTSNWGKDYFYASRNVGLIVDGAPFAEALEARFTQTWDSEYAEPVQPGAHYEARAAK